MTHPIRRFLQGLLLGTATVASAFNYTNSDLMLVLRKDQFNDAIFDLGSVSNFLGLANGSTVTVTNWSLSLAKSTYGNNLGGVSFVILAATSLAGDQDPLRVWTTDASLDTNSPPTDLAPSRWRNLRSTISSVGWEASVLTSSNSTPSYVVSATDPSAYTYLVSWGGQYDPSTISGFAPCTVETPIPATQLFYEVKSASTTPKPASALVGSFQFNTNGVLTFTAGPLVQSQATPVPTSIVGWQRNGTTTTLSFPTTNRLNYRLWYLNTLATPWTWSSNATTISGDGTIKTFTDTYAGATRFYRIESLP